MSTDLPRLVRVVTSDALHVGADVAAPLDAECQALLACARAMLHSGNYLLTVDLFGFRFTVFRERTPDLAPLGAGALPFDE